MQHQQSFGVALRLRLRRAEAFAVKHPVHGPKARSLERGGFPWTVPCRGYRVNAGLWQTAALHGPRRCPARDRSEFRLQAASFWTTPQDSWSQCASTCWISPLPMNQMHSPVGRGSSRAAHSLCSTPGPAPRERRPTARFMAPKRVHRNKGTPHESCRLTAFGHMSASCPHRCIVWRHSSDSPKQV